MQRILAITGLTWKAAFRFRLFVVVAVLLLAAVIGLPIKTETIWVSMWLRSKALSTQYN